MSAIPRAIAHRSSKFENDLGSPPQKQSVRRIQISPLGPSLVGFFLLPPPPCKLPICRPHPPIVGFLLVLLLWVSVVPTLFASAPSLVSSPPLPVQSKKALFLCRRDRLGQTRLLFFQQSGNAGPRRRHCGQLLPPVLRETHGGIQNKNVPGGRACIKQCFLIWGGGRGGGGVGGSKIIQEGG